MDQGNLNHFYRMIYRTSKKTFGDGKYRLNTPEISLFIRWSRSGKFIIEEFIGDDKVALVLGDNIFYGSGLSKLLQSCSNPEGGIVFTSGCTTRHGVARRKFKSTSLSKKPTSPKSNYAVPAIFLR
jgi:hypothetical protein